MAEHCERLCCRIRCEHERANISEGHDTEWEQYENPSSRLIVLVEEIEKHYSCNDCQVKFQGVKDKVSQPVACQAHTCDDLNMLHLCDAFNDQVTYCYCNYD